MARYVPSELILQARRIRKEKGYTYQYIISRAAETPNYTNMTTVRRFFTADLNQHRFSFQAVQGILDVIFDGTEAETVQALRVEIEELERQLEEERRQHAEEILTIKANEEIRLDFVRTSLVELLNQIQQKDRILAERDALIVELFRKLLEA